MRRFSVLLTAALVAAASSVSAQQQPTLRLLASADINGQLAGVDCDDPGAPSPFATAAASLAAAPDTLAIDTGNLVGAAAVSRLAVLHDADAFARAVREAGWRGLVVGHRELFAPREVVVRAATALEASGVPYVLSNLHCAPSASALCAHVASADHAPVLLPSPAGPVGLVAAVAPRWLASVARDRAEGVTLEDPAPALTRAIDRARAAGARYVVAVYEPSSQGALADALAVASHVRADILLVNGVAGQITRAVAPHTNTLLVATNPGAVTTVAPGETATPPPSRAVAPDDPAARYAVATTRWLCDANREPLAGGALDRALSQEAFADLLLDVLRDRAQAEVAVINRGSVSAADLFPLHTGQLRRLDVVSALPFDNQVRVLRVTGAQLASFAHSDRTGRFYIRGMDIDGDAVKINGRALDEAVDYRVVTTDYVASGGDGGVTDSPLAAAPLGNDSARDTFMRWLAVAHEGPLLSAPVDPAHRTRWTLRYTADLSFENVAVSNPGMLMDSQVARPQLVALRGETEFRADADHPRYSWQNDVLLRYGGNITTPAGMTMAAPWQETADLITARSRAVLRNVRPGDTHSTGLVPYADGYLESEFTPGSNPSMVMPGQTNHLEIRPTAGALFEATDTYSIYAGFGLDWEVLHATSGEHVSSAVSLGWELRPTTLFHVGTRAVTGESTFELVFRSPPNTTARFHAKLSMPIIEPLSLTIGYDAYAAFARPPVPGDTSGMASTLPFAFGFAGDLTIGLKITYARALQSFRF